MSDSTPHPSLSTVQATLDGLDRYIKTEFTNFQRQIDPLKDIPVKVERLSANLDSVTDRVDDLEEDKDKSKNASLQWISIATVVLIGIGTMAVNFLQVLNG